MTEITWITDRHNAMMRALGIYIPVKWVHDIISNYTLGFVHIGKLDTPAFTSQEFSSNYITCQIKYIGGFTFIDFWRIVLYDSGDVYYPCGWNVDHYTYIYKDAKLYRDKVSFFLLYANYNIMDSKPSYPIYDMKKLAHETFIEFDCNPDWITSVNDTPISDSSCQSQIFKLFTLFTTLTENLSESVYENATYIK